MIDFHQIRYGGPTLNVIEPLWLWFSFDRSKGYFTYGTIYVISRVGTIFKNTKNFDKT